MLYHNQPEMFHSGYQLIKVSMTEKLIVIIKTASQFSLLFIIAILTFYFHLLILLSLIYIFEIWRKKKEYNDRNFFFTTERDL